MTPDIEALVARHEAVFRAHVPMFPSITCADDRESWPCSTLMDLARRADALTAAEAEAQRAFSLAERPITDALDRIHRLRMDLLAYGRHMDTCTKGRVLAETTQKHAPPVRDPECSCGFDAALAAHDPHVEH